MHELTHNNIWIPLKKKEIWTTFNLHYVIFFNSCPMVLKLHKTSEGLFEGDFVSKCAGKFLLMSIGGEVEHHTCEGHHYPLPLGVAGGT